MFPLRFLCVLGLTALTLVSCRNATLQTQAERKDPVEGMVFLTFVMRVDSVSGKKVELVGKTIIPQKLKAEPENSKASNRVWISQLTSKGDKLSALAIEHPLFKRVEFANDQGRFESKEINLKDAEFFVRVTLFAQTAYIQVDEELSGKTVYSTRFNIRD